MPLPTHVEDVVRDVRTRASKRVERWRNDIKRVEDKANADTNALYDAAAEYIVTGIAVPQRGSLWVNAEIHSIGWGHRGFNWSSFFRQLAREMERPYVYASAGGVRLPNRRYCDPLLAMWTLTDKGVVRIHRYTTYTTVGPTTWEQRHKFAGLVEGWKRACATEPKMRAALRLP